MDFALRKFLSLLFVSLFATLFSLNVFSYDFLNSQAFELSAGFGIGKLQVGNSDFTVTETETDSLIQSHNPIFGDANFGIAYVLPLNQKYSYHHVKWLPTIKPSLNLRYFSQNVQGQVYQYQDSDLDNYTYNLGLDSTRLMFDLALTLASIQHFSVFVLGGIGEGWTQTSYSDRPNAGIEGGSLSLKSRRNCNFVSEVGTGISYDIEKNFGITLEYLYSNYAAIKTSSTGTLDGEATSIIPARFPLRSQEAIIEFYLKV